MRHFNSTPKISIIIPVYNTEKFLEQCINSILSQSFTDFECILVNDGSTDRTPVICDEYQKKDSRIIVIHQVNNGASCARNAGLNIAKGEFITFVDGDDWINENYLSILYKNISENNCDMSVCGYKSINEKDDLFIEKQPSSLLFLNQISAKRALFDYKFLGTRICCKLVNRQFIYNNNIRFDSKITVCEDGLFWFRVINNLQKVVYDSTPSYIYLIHENSITNSSEKYFNYMSNFTATNKMLYIEKNKNVIWDIKLFNGKIARNICIALIKSNNTQKKLYNFYRYHLFISMYYLLFDINIDYKFKIISLLLLFPKLFIFLKIIFSLYKRLKFTVKKKLKNYKKHA
jgi:glycosyltransferase involved in cell wall biosynthesis